MNLEQALYFLKRMKYRYLTLRVIEISFGSISMALLVFALTRFLAVDFYFRFFPALFCAIAFGTWMFLRYQLHRLRSDFFAHYLNRQFPQLNESADLLLMDDQELSLLQQVQKAKTLQQLKQVLPEVKLPHRLLPTLVVFVICTALYFASSSATLPTRTETAPIPKEIRPVSTPSAVYIKSLSVFISPPPYTKLTSFESTDFNLTLPEGSTVKWLARFSSQLTDAKIFFSGKDSTRLNKQGTNEYSLQNEIHEPGFYQLQWRAAAKVYRSDFYRIEVIKDQPPKIAIKELNQFTKLKYTDQLTVLVKSGLTDDYGLTDAQIVATVSKGSGEGVKFREEKLRFASPIQGKKQEATRMLDLRKLGLEPADELYFYVEAVDNKIPVPNRSRTETFFIAIQDTAREITSVDSGLGVDLMPEYFRSQRQIIIDTEKLLRDKKNISIKQFNFTSNELGYDQKVLRLRYGQFLGEEEEAGIGQPEDEEPQEEGEGEEKVDPLKGVSHQHDTKNEHNLVDQKGKHDKHPDENQNGEEKEDPLKQFVHEHDNTEEATFFIQSLKTKLKAAITQMWDAELYLRLYQPEKSLPYQYKALNLLKEISSDSRIFVHRSGFDPPPLKEEKRLTADLSEVKNRSDLLKAQNEERLSASKEALNAVEKMIAENSTLVSPSDRKKFHKAGQELAVMATEQPIVFLKGLSFLKSLSENSSEITINDLFQLRTILSKAIPERAPIPTQQHVNGHALNKQFLNQLDQSKHE